MLWQDHGAQTWKQRNALAVSEDGRRGKQHFGLVLASQQKQDSEVIDLWLNQGTYY